MIYLLAILFFIAYSLVVFIVSNIWILLGCTIFNVMLILAFNVSFKRTLQNLSKLLFLVLIVFVFNLIFDSIISSLIICWKLLIVANFAFIFSNKVTPTMLANGLSLLFFPLKLFKVNTEDIVLIIVIALNLLPIFSEEARILKFNLRARNIKMNMKTLFTKSHVIFVMFFASLFRRVNELEMAMLARNYGK